MTLEELKQKMDAAGYVYDDTMATVLYVALLLGRPLLIEGDAGVGKTEIAKVMASALGRELVRLQCYEGLDESKALYEWNYQKQLLSIQVNRDICALMIPGVNGIMNVSNAFTVKNLLEVFGLAVIPFALTQIIRIIRETVHA